MGVNSKEIYRIRLYALDTWNNQRTSRETGKPFRFPPYPKFLSKDARTILRVYKNMVRVWMNSGGCAPDLGLLPLIDLLLVMGRNHIVFARDKNGKKLSAASGAKEGSEKAD